MLACVNRGAVLRLLRVWVCCLICEIAVAGDTGTWPQWRGPMRSGRVNEGAWPDRLQPSVLEERWRVEMPPSYSGAIVSTDTVYVTYTKDKKSEGVSAFDRATGSQRWQAEWPETMQVADLGTSMGSWIRATPTVDGQSLFVAGMPDVLVCLDAQTGAKRWKVNFNERYGTPLPELGFVCSPLVVDDAVYVQAADSFVKVNKTTGASVWRCLERIDKGQGAYSSPDFAIIKGRPQLLVANIDSIAGIDTATGDVLWQRVLDSYDQGCILAPIVYRDGIFTSTRASQSGYYPLTFQNGKFAIADGWKNKLVVYMSSPVVIGENVFAHLKNGRFACVDLRDGTVRWISHQTFGTYCSLAWCDDRILALTNEGHLLLLRANPDQFELLDSREVSTAETWGHIAVAGQEIFIREKNAIVAYRWQ